MKNRYKKFFLAFVLIFPASAFAQDDLLSLLDSTGAKKTHEKVIATFKTSKVINAQSIETVKKGTMDFRVTHRFGNAGTASGGGGHTLYGLDNSTDIRISFDFGITDNLTVGVARSKANELIDGLVKYRFLTQTTDNHIPLSVAFYGDMSYNPQTADQFYNGAVRNADFHQNDIHRLAYVAQLLIAHKFGSRLSVQLIPSFQHRNYVLANINPDNGSEETNDLISIGGGFRLKVTKRVSLIADYFYTFSDYRTNNSASPFYNPLAVGVEIETGGHVFHINFTNAAGIIENNYIPYTTDSWLKGGYKFGFNISRVFNLTKKHAPRKQVEGKS
ncbi:MAG: hypothetical protein K0Q95_1935 [Bacteroidota bacterium]|jgi:hypothetical protein|nr:hypothetical protein [Bacteroidota bacterium]